VKPAGCGVCSDNFQCQGAFNAIRKCKDPVEDVVFTVSKITTSPPWKSELNKYKLSPNPAAVAAGLAAAKRPTASSPCDAKYGQPRGCGSAKAASCKVA